MLGCWRSARKDGVLIERCTHLMIRYRWLSWPTGLDVLSAGVSLVAVLDVIYGLKRSAQEGVGWTAALSIVTLGRIATHQRRYKCVSTL
jgi:hypothetical protein